MAGALGTFTFRAFHRPGDPKAGPEILAEEVSVLRRLGIDGVNIRRDGRNREPFQMESRALVSTAAAVATLIDAYNAAQGLVATLNWEGIDFTATFSTAYAIQLVSNIRVSRLGAAISDGIDATGSYLVTATWNLVAVDVSQLTGGGS